MNAPHLPVLLLLAASLNACGGTPFSTAFAAADDGGNDGGIVAEGNNTGMGSAVDSGSDWGSVDSGPASPMLDGVSSGSSVEAGGLEGGNDGGTPAVDASDDAPVRGVTVDGGIDAPWPCCAFDMSQTYTCAYRTFWALSNPNVTVAGAGCTANYYGSDGTRYTCVGGIVTECR